MNFFSVLRVKKLFLHAMQTHRGNCNKKICQFNIFSFYNSGIVFTKCIQRYGLGMVAIGGSVLGAVGLFASSFAPDIPFVIVSTGVIAGKPFERAIYNDVQELLRYGSIHTRYNKKTKRQNQNKYNVVASV